MYTCMYACVYVCIYVYASFAIPPFKNTHYTFTCVDSRHAHIHTHTHTQRERETSSPMSPEAGDILQQLNNGSKWYTHSLSLSLSFFLFLFLFFCLSLSRSFFLSFFLDVSNI